MQNYKMSMEFLLKSSKEFQTASPSPSCNCKPACFCPDAWHYFPNFDILILRIVRVESTEQSGIIEQYIDKEKGDKKPHDRI